MKTEGAAVLGGGWWCRGLTQTTACRAGAPQTRGKGHGAAAFHRGCGATETTHKHHPDPPSDTTSSSFGQEKERQVADVLHQTLELTMGKTCALNTYIP